VDTSGYTCLVYKTTTGQIVADFPLADQPQWTRQINTASQMQVKIRPGDTGVPPRDRLYGLVVPKVFSLAILWDDYVCQAGPILPYSIDDTSSTLLQIGAGDFWSLLGTRLLHNPGWDPTAARITDTSADTSITDNLPNIALTLVRNAVNWTHRPGSALPLDVPDNGDNTGTTIVTRTYPGYDMAYVGERLNELSQESAGPDIDFQPYLVTGSNYIRHRMRVGRASDGHLVQPGNTPVFDYGSSLRALTISGDGKDVSTSAFVKGSGDKNTLMYGYAASTNLIDLGWPASDYVDNNHISASAQDQLDGWAAGDLALYGKAVEQWTGYVTCDVEPRLGSFEPGTFATYSITSHPWLPEGRYSVRIIGLSQGRGTGEVAHILQGKGPF